MANSLHTAFLLALVCYASASLNLFQETELLSLNSNVPTDKNFTVDTFVGTWNVVALYGVPGINNRTCPLLDVKKTVTTSLALTLESNDYNTSNFDVLKKTYQPNPVNKAILLDILDPVAANNIAVSYYNDTAGLALLVNMNAKFAAALSKSENIYDNMFLETVNDILSGAGIPVNETELINHFGCTSTYNSIATLNVSALPGTYYGNAIFTNSPLLSELNCYNIEIQEESGAPGIYNITQYLQYNGYGSNISANYAPSPINEGLLINIDTDLSASLVINYYDSANDIYALLAHDGSYAFVISTQKSLQASTLDSIENILKGEGLNINASNFITLPNACQVSDTTTKNFLEY